MAIKTVPVNFVVDTVLYYYCVYYEIYWNSLYQPPFHKCFYWLMPTNKNTVKLEKCGVPLT